MNKKSPNLKAKQALKEAIDRLFAVCDSPSQRKPFWVVSAERLSYQISSPVPQKALQEALSLALKRHRGLFIQEPIFKKTHIVFDGTQLSLILIHAILAESLQLLLDEIDDCVLGKKPLLPRAFLAVLTLVVNKHLVSREIGERKWVPALEGIMSEQEFEQATHACLKRRLLQKERELMRLIKQIRNKKQVSRQKLLLVTEMEHVWKQAKNLGLEAKEMIWTDSIVVRMNALKRGNS